MAIAAKSEPTTPRPSGSRAVVRELPFAADDEALLERLQRREPPAMAALCDRYGCHVRRVLGRILGPVPEVADLHQEVFLRAIRHAHRLRDARSLSGWLSTIAVNVARTHLRRSARRRWLGLAPSAQEPPEQPVTRDDDAAEALRRTYIALSSMRTDERIAFALRFVDGMSLSEIAVTTEVSLATVKRRLARAQKAFVTRAKRDEVLCRWLEEGNRWS
jgi:RNA polymerase sigma-70 factor (ECF subfamily)